MFQLMSACRQGFSSDAESKKSRRSLFMSPKTERDDAPVAKRRRSADDVLSIKGEVEVRFSHSPTSPFKRIAGEKSNPTSRSSRQASPKDKSVQPTSPEQKVLLERQKQQKLMEEQRNFDSQDVRWKRIERELEKAFPTAAAQNRATMVHQSSSPVPYGALVEQSSVAIQASLIEDVSPLKPLSYYRKLRSPWKSEPFPVSSSKAPASSSPVSFPGATAINLHAFSPVPILPASERPTRGANAGSGNGLLLQISPPSSTSLVWATPTPPSGNSTPSPSQFIRVPGQGLNTPALYSPRSLTPTPEPGHLDSSQNPSVADKGNVAMSSLLSVPGNVCRMESSAFVFAGSHPTSAGDVLIPAQNQAVSTQGSSTALHVNNAEMLSFTPTQLSVTSGQFSFPFSKALDLNGAVCTVTPTSTVQLLSDVSKRLSLPLVHDHHSSS